jgi:hypothetical protein
LNEDKYKVMALIAPELATSVVIGTDFLNEYRVKLDFTNNHFETRLVGIVRKYKFYRGPAEVVGRFDNTHRQRESYTPYQSGMQKVR